jgi:hypothetical protein
MNLSFAFRLLSSVFCRLSSVTELALFFRGLKTANFSYSFYIKELTTILTLQKLALFCIKTGKFVEHSRLLSSKPWQQVPRLTAEF